MPDDPPPDGGRALSLNDAYALAARLYETGDLAAAGQVTASILAARPDLPEVHHLDGLIRLNAGRPQEAAVCFETALRGRRTTNTLNALAGALQQCGRIAEAVELIRETAASEPELSSCRFNLGVLLQAAGRDGEALDAYLAAGRLGGADGFSTAARRRYELGDTAGAMRAFEAACVLQPNRAEAMTGLGLCRTAFGRRVEALRLHERALIVDPLRLEDVIHGWDNVRCRLLFAAQQPWSDRAATALTAASDRSDWRLLSSLLYRDLYRPLTDAARIAGETVLDRRPPPAHRLSFGPSAQPSDRPGDPVAVRRPRPGPFRGPRLFPQGRRSAGRLRRPPSRRLRMRP